MAVATYSMIWEVGEDLELNFTYKQGPTGEEEPVDLSTDYAVRMDIRSNDTNKTLLFTYNSADIVETPPVDVTGGADNEITLGSDGTINIFVSRAAVLPAGTIYEYMKTNNINSFVYDIFVRNTDINRQKKILAGTISLNDSVTRWA